MKKILVVDNHPVILKFMKNLLEKEGYRVRTAHDGLSALEMIEKEVPDVIFTDMVMPNIDGEKLCRIIRSNPDLENVSIVILSSVADSEELDFAMLGANACISKGPFDEMAGHVVSALEFLKTGTVPSAEGGIFGTPLHSDVKNELLSTRRHYEIILKNISEGVMEVALDTRVVYANAFALYLVGVSEEDLLGREFPGFFTGEDSEAIRRILEPEGNLPRSIPKDSPAMINGKQVSVNVIPVRDLEQRSFIVILNDVSELRRTKALLREARDQIETLST
jgi:PAS domain S-box-containing protein